MLDDLTGLLPVTRELAHKYGDAFADLAARGDMIGINDVWIVATALSAGLALATSDRGFSRIKGLVVEDWRAP